MAGASGTVDDEVGCTLFGQFLRPGLVGVVEAAQGAQRHRVLNLFLGGRGHPDLSAGGPRELQRETSHTPADAGDQDTLPCLQLSLCEQGSVGGHTGQGQGTRLGGTQVIWSRMKLQGRYRHIRGERTVAWHTEDVVTDGLGGWILTPVQSWIDDHLPTAPGGIDTLATVGDPAGAIGAENHGDFNAGILSLCDPVVAAIQYGCGQFDDHLTRLRRGPGAFNELSW